MIDSHCHIAGEEFAADLDAVVERARAAGVSRALVILAAEDDAEFARTGAVLKAWPECRFAIGVHPHHAKAFESNPQAAADTVAARLDALPEARAIGEIGLDYHYDLSPREIQGQVFASQLTIARDLGLPAVVHCRKAVEDVWAIVREMEVRIVLHCCTERWEDVERFVESGHFLSFTGIATYPNAAEVRRTIAACPLDRLMIETDSPYLAPVPRRGARNEPAFVAEVLRCIAEIKGLPAAEIDGATTRNAVGFFGLPL